MLTQPTDGMERVVCIPQAKVRIVKVWDPELELACAQMSAVEMTSCDHGVVAKIKRVIMERDLYPRRWGMGPVATEKKKMKEAGT